MWRACFLSLFSYKKPLISVDNTKRMIFVTFTKSV